VKTFLKAGGETVALVKPQFELGPKEMKKDVKKGVVRSEELREKAVAQVESAARALGFETRGRAWSPIEGAKGNRECLILLSRSDCLSP
jgi:23S rRNA (cytidine1920-2'-O)/16S rRNA (cytidine1409-2'-O)-methyltransferase